MDVCFNDPNSTFEGARMSVAGFPPQRTLPRAQQDRIDDQQDFIRKPMFEQRRCQRGATREDKVRAVLRLDAANALDDVRSKALERAPFKTFRTVGSDIFCCRIEAVRHRTARRLWPEARPDIVGATAKQQIEAPAMRGDDCLPASGGPIGRSPVAVGEIAVFAGDLDHAVQRDVFDDFELSHLSLRVLGLEFLFCWHCEELAHLDRCAAGDDGFASPRHGLIHVGCVEYPKAANVFLGLKVWSIGDDHLSAGLLTQ